MTTNLEYVYDKSRDRILTMSEENKHLLTVASGRDDEGNWFVMSRRQYNKLKNETESIGMELLFRLMES